MKSILFSVVLSLVTIFFHAQTSFAQSSDTTNSVSAKTNQIVTLLKTKLNLTDKQVPLVQSLVSDFAAKFAKSDAGVAKSSGLKEKLEKDMQSKLVTDFSTQLPKLLNSDQAAQYAGIKDKISSLLTQIK